VVAQQAHPAQVSDLETSFCSVLLVSGLECSLVSGLDCD